MAYEWDAVETLIDRSTCIHGRFVIGPLGLIDGKRSLD